MEALSSFIQQEAERKYNFELTRYGEGSKKGFIEGMERMAEHMAEILEWTEKDWTIVKSKELGTSAWINCKENDVMVHGSDYHYTKLIKEAGITTSQLIDRYFQEQGQVTIK